MAVLTVFVEAMCVGFEISSAQPGHGTATSLFNPCQS